uniref:Rab-GAP TBC domain-containing protein n=1 Tax=Trypanosoma congolense (strain IL3000) TaxID=1068625 RepID=G0UNE1_TRYCI|nr:conserved hypothetical protein [Trypanosoma congolense IL3000]
MLPSGLEALNMLFHLLEAMCKDHVPPEASRTYDGALRPLCRLLLQYHDPELSLHLDRHLVDVSNYMLSWLRRHFVTGNDCAAAIRIWDWLLTADDPSLGMYLAIAYLIFHRQEFLLLTTKEGLQEALESLKFQVEVPEGKEASYPQPSCGGPKTFSCPTSGKVLLQNANVVRLNTPCVTRQVIKSLLYPGEYGRKCARNIQKSPEELAHYYSSLATLPLECGDYLHSFAATPAKENGEPPLKYTVMDCRARVSYEAARLPTAVHVGDEIDFDMEKISKVVSSFAGVRGEHICVFGTGRQITEEINLLNVLSLRLVEGFFPYISCGRFRSIIPLIKAGEVAIMGSAVEGGVQRMKGDIGEVGKAVISGILQRVELTDVSGKAKEGMEVAKSWGLGFIKRVGGRLKTKEGDESAQHAAKTLETTTTDVGEVAPGKVDSFPRPESNPAKKDVFSQGRGNNPSRHIFSLGDDANDNDDFDLIETVSPQRVSATKAAVEKKRAETTIESSSAPSVVNERAREMSGAQEKLSAAESVAAPPKEITLANDNLENEIDEEFEKLFGDTA